MPDSADLAFVYGSLKRGGEYEWVMTKAGGIYIADARMKTPYPLLLDRYPCLMDEPGKGFRVKGEVYRIPDPEGWKHLDWLEDHPNEYVRKQVPVIVNGSTEPAWTYFYRWPDLLEPGLAAVEEFAVGPGSNDSV